MVPFGPKAGYYTKVIQRGNQVVAVPAIKWDGKFADVKPFGARARNLQCRNGCGKMFDHGPARATHEKAMRCVPKTELDARLSAMEEDAERARADVRSGKALGGDTDKHVTNEQRVRKALGINAQRSAALVPVPILVVYK